MRPSDRVSYRIHILSLLRVERKNGIEWETMSENLSHIGKQQTKINTNKLVKQLEVYWFIVQEFG